MSDLTVASLAASINDDAAHFRHFWVCAAMREQTQFWTAPAHRALLCPDAQRILDYYIETKREATSHVA
jgi:hypothetical protein